MESYVCSLLIVINKHTYIMSMSVLEHAVTGFVEIMYWTPFWSDIRIIWCNTSALLMMIRIKWICPTCMELSPIRHWSAERHIKRKHAGRRTNKYKHTSTRTQMNIHSGWFNIHDSTNMMEFTHETNKLQRGAVATAITIITLKVIIILAYIKIYLEKRHFSVTVSNYDNEKNKKRISFSTY